MKKLNLKISYKGFIISTLILLLCATYFDSSAQFGIAIGPKAGVSVSTFRGDVNNVDARVSWLGGVFLNTQITSAFTLQPEIIFSQKGGEFTDNGVRNSIVINYFEVPVLAKLRFPIDDIVFPHILLGPNFAYRTNLKFTRFDTETGNTITTNESDIRKSDVGGIVGAGIDIQTRNSGLFFTVDGRYSFGFNNLDRRDNSIEVRNAGWSLALGVGYLLTR